MINILSFFLFFFSDFSGDTILLIHTFYCGKNGVFSLPKTSSITPIRHLPQGNLMKSLFTVSEMKNLLKGSFKLLCIYLWLKNKQP